MKKCKKTVVVILALMMLMSSVPSFGAAPKFSDVPAPSATSKGHWAYAEIEKMASLGYIKGVGDGKFDPEVSLNFNAALTLLARLTNPTATEISTASYKFANLLNELKIQQDWERQGLAIALEKNIITIEELRDVYKKGLINKPISKVDTGEYLVKAIGLDEVAKSKTVLSSQSIPYKDYLSIGASQLKYVSVLLDIGVYHPDGVGGGIFAPNSNLTRAVMAKMMATAYDYLQKNPTIPTTPEPPKQPEGEKISSTITKITDMGVDKFLSVDNGRGGEVAYIITKDTKYTLDGKTASYLDLIQGQKVEIIIKKGTYEILSLNAESIEGTILGKIKSIDNIGYKIKVEYLENKKLVTSEFNIDNKASIYLNNKSVYLRELKEGDIVELYIKNSTIHELYASSKINEIEGLIKEISPVKNSTDKEFYITIVDSKDKSHKFLINSSSILYRNDKKIDSGEKLKLKDEVVVEVEYDLEREEYIANLLEAEVVRKDIKGIIVGMETRLQEATKITILNQETKKEESYTLGKVIYIRVDNTVANSYDLKAGFYVEVVTEGDEITEIEANSAGVEATMIGKILTINSRNRSLELEITDFSLDGSKFGDQITIYENNVVVLDRYGTKLNFEYLYRGDIINVIGSYDGSTFIANTIIILR